MASGVRRLRNVSSCVCALSPFASPVSGRSGMTTLLQFSPQFSQALSDPSSTSQSSAAELSVSTFDQNQNHCKRAFHSGPTITDRCEPRTASMWPSFSSRILGGTCLPRSSIACSRMLTFGAKLQLSVDSGSLADATPETPTTAGVTPEEVTKNPTPEDAIASPQDTRAEDDSISKDNRDDLGSDSGSRESPSAVGRGHRVVPEPRGSVNPGVRRDLLPAQISALSEQAEKLGLSDLNKELSNLIATHRFGEAKELFRAWISAKETNQAPVLTYNFLLHAMMRDEDSPDSIERVMSEMRAKGVAPNPLSYNALLRAAFRRNDSLRADGIFNRMAEAGIRPDADSYNMMVTLCAISRRVNAAMQHLNAMLKNGYIPAKATFHELLTACARTRRSRDALAILKELGEQSASPVPSQLGELVSMSLESEDAECAFFVLKLIASRNVSIDDGALLLVMNLAARSSRTSLAELSWSVLFSQKNRVQGVAPAFHLARIHTYASAGDLTTTFRALREFEDAIDQRQLSAEVDLNAAGYSREEMLNPYTSLLPITNILCQGVGVVDNAYYKIENMHVSGEAISLAGINCIIAACAKLRDADRAEQTFDEIEQTFSLQPDTGTFNALIDAYGRVSKIEEAERKFKTILDKGLTPSAHSYSLLVDAFIMNFHPEKALHYVNKMHEAGHIPSRDLLMRLLRRSKRENFEEGSVRAELLIHKIGYRPAAANEAFRRAVLGTTAVSLHEARPSRRFRAEY